MMTAASRPERVTMTSSASSTTWSKILARFCRTSEYGTVRTVPPWLTYKKPYKPGCLCTPADASARSNHPRNPNRASKAIVPMGAITVGVLGLQRIASYSRTRSAWIHTHGGGTLQGKVECGGDGFTE